MGFKNVGKQIVEEVSYGMYVWVLPDGYPLSDQDNNVMNVFVLSRKDRPAAKAAITQAAAHYGFPEGEAVFWSGKRPISDEELEEQLLREKFGLIADPLDYASISEEQERKYYHGR